MNKKILLALSKVYHKLLLTHQSWSRHPSRMKKVAAKVISVGNITWGGTGKTPLVVKLARDLSYYGKKVAVLTRGYGQDEVEELRKKLPHVPILVGKNRSQKAQEAIDKHKAEYLILDDGFQHIRLHRDLDIVNISAVQPFGPGGLLPQGSLREPIEHLSRAHVFVLSKSNMGAKNIHWIRQKLASIKPHAQIFEAIHRPLKFYEPAIGQVHPLEEIKRKKVATLSGIADPLSFEKMVENLGADIVFAARFEDHHLFTDMEIGMLVRKCQKLGIQDVITTHKDMVRLRKFLKRSGFRDRLRLLVLEIEFQVSDEEDFIRRCLNP